MSRLRSYHFDPRSAEINDVANWHEDTSNSLRLFYSERNPEFVHRFAFSSPEEVRDEEYARLQETQQLAALGMVSAIEAALRRDFILRCIKGQSDDLSLHFKTLYRDKGLKVSLEEDILGGWKLHSSIQSHEIGQIKGVFKFRHWLAHGRYWVPSLGRNYDFQSVYAIASVVLNSFPLLRS